VWSPFWNPQPTSASGVLGPRTSQPEIVLMNAVGDRVRRLREEQGLTQREIASPGVSYAYISRIESGTRKPSEKALRHLAERLGTTALYLETGSERGHCPHCDKTS
jgi:ribosome-binding protein aMBF1 (putative translation factor)